MLGLRLCAGERFSRGHPTVKFLRIGSIRPRKYSVNSLPASGIYAGGAKPAVAGLGPFPAGRFPPASVMRPGASPDRVAWEPVARRSPAKHYRCGENVLRTPAFCASSVSMWQQRAYPRAFTLRYPSCCTDTSRSEAEKSKKSLPQALDITGSRGILHKPVYK